MITRKISRWDLHYENESYACEAPCSLYSVLMDYKKMEHPYEGLNEKAATVLGWRAEYNIEDMCRDSYNWQLKNPRGSDE